MSFHYETKIEAETTGPVYQGWISKAFVLQHTTLGKLKADLEAGLRSREHELRMLFLEKGIVASNVNVKDATVWFEERIQQGGQVFIRAKVSYDVEFWSDKKLTGSPILAEMVFFLKHILPIVVGAILGALFLHYLMDWLKAMTTKWWKVTYYDDEGNIDRTEEGGGPDVGGMGMVWVFLIIIVILGLFWFVGPPMKRRRRKK